MYHAIVAQGADPAYARITCTNDVAIVEHLALANGVRHCVATQRNYLSHANVDLLDEHVVEDLDIAMSQNDVSLSTAEVIMPSND